MVHLYYTNDKLTEILQKKLLMRNILMKLKRVQTTGGVWF